jgi:hypothetical protein
MSTTCSMFDAWHVPATQCCPPEHTLPQLPAPQFCRPKRRSRTFLCREPVHQYRTSASQRRVQPRDPPRLAHPPRRHCRPDLRPRQKSSMLRESRMRRSRSRQPRLPEEHAGESTHSCPSEPRRAYSPCCLAYAVDVPSRSFSDRVSFGGHRYATSPVAGRSLDAP